MMMLMKSLTGQQNNLNVDLISVAHQAIIDISCREVIYGHAIYIDGGDRKSFGPVHALKSVNLTVYPGEYMHY